MKFGEVEHRIEPALRLAAAEPEKHPVERDVLARGHLGVEPHPELDEWGHPSGHPHLPGVRSVDAGEDLQQRALARPVTADDPEELPLVDLERHIAQCTKLAVLRPREWVRDALLERVHPVLGNPEGLGNTAGVDHDRSGARAGARRCRRTGRPSFPRG